MKEKLIESLTRMCRKSAEHDGVPICDEKYCSEHCEDCYGNVADVLLADGWIRLPCKVGDTVWQTDGVRLYQSTIKQILLTPKSVFFETGNIVFVEDAICDKRIFLTREEAEAALKEGQQ